MRSSSGLRKIVVALSAAMVVCAVLLAQAPPPSSEFIRPEQVIAYLNQCIDWYRTVESTQQVATRPVDVLFFNSGRQTARQALQLAFDFARADARLLQRHGAGAPKPPPAPPAGKYQNLYKMAADADAEVQQRQAQLDSLKARLPGVRGRARRRLQSQVDSLQSELGLEQARAQALHNLLQFVGGAGASGGSLLGQIDELERSVPEAQPSTAGNAGAPAAASAASAAAQARNPQFSGVIAVVEDLIALNRKAGVLDQAARSTTALAESSQRLRSPLVEALSAISEQGDKAIEQEQTAGPAGEQSQKALLGALTADYKTISDLVLPLGKQAILLNSYQDSLARWHDSIRSQYNAELKALLLRLAILGIVVALVIAFAEIWRKAIFHYVHDVRRRYQMLLIRRVILWFAIAIAVAFSLASEIGSLATFVGLITAGVAVALQNVILAIAGYFFLIGKYGVRVGDRVQISGITGKVVDIGLIRLHLMEISGSDAVRQPTGRIVVFSNAIVFQPGASFFKQIPGTNFVWHEITLTLAPDSDYALVEKRVLEAVQKVYDRYREKIERQHELMQETLNLVVDVPRPKTRLRLTASGLEVVIRYPTELETAAEIDDQVTRELVAAIEKSPRLKLVGTGTPSIQAVPDGGKVA